MSFPNIHDRARQLSAQSGRSLQEAYAELSRRAAASRRAKKRVCCVPYGASDHQMVESPRRMWLPYADS